jgi:hypothetical protein
MPRANITSEAETGFWFEKGDDGLRIYEPGTSPQTEDPT